MGFFRKALLPGLVAGLYKLWTKTWRLTILENPKLTERLKAGPVTFAFWHGDELVLAKIGPHFKSAAMISTSDDGELMAQILTRFGFGVSRGSSTRGGVRALVGIVRLVKQGYNATIAVDGPKGPRHKVKAGVFHLSKHADAPICPAGAAKSSAITFHKSWNKTYFPLPFAKVVISLGEPIPVPLDLNDEAVLQFQETLEHRLYLEQGVANKFLLGDL